MTVSCHVQRKIESHFASTKSDTNIFKTQYLVILNKISINQAIIINMPLNYIDIYAYFLGLIIG